MDVVEALLAAGADVDAQSAAYGETALHLACEAPGPGADGVVEALLGAGADVGVEDAGGATALFRACNGGRPGAVRALLAAGARPEAAVVVGETALHVACLRGFEGVAVALLEAGADPGVRDGAQRLPIHRAQAFGRDRILALLKAWSAVRLVCRVLCVDKPKLEDETTKNAWRSVALVRALPLPVLGSVLAMVK